jgi:hypothetical protein
LLVILELEFHKLFAQAGLPSGIFLISPSQVARISGASHPHLAPIIFSKNRIIMVTLRKLLSIKYCVLRIVETDRLCWLCIFQCSLLIQQIFMRCLLCQTLF